MKKLSIFPIALFLLLQISCKKNINVSPTSVLTSANFWKTESDATGALNGMYVNLRGETDLDLWIFGEGRSQTMSQALAGTVGLDIYYLNSLNSTTVSVTWAGLYTTVNAANLILKYVPNINITTAGSKNNILAQAHTMRAFCYYVMARTWGGVPMRVQPTEGYDPATIQLPRSSVDSVFGLIKRDLDSALALYPNYNFVSGRDQWNKAGADVLKADVYLWTGKLMGGGAADFQTALNALNDAQTASLSLQTNYSDVFNYTNKGNNEIIMASHYQTLESNNNFYQYMYLNSSNSPSNITQGTKDTIGVIGTGNAGNSIMQVSAAVRSQFTADDTRKAATFYEIYSTSNSFVTSITGIKGYGMVGNGTRYFTNDFIIYRYADVLLLKAEAENALGMDPSAEINAIRKRAYGANAGNHPFVSGSIAANDNVILQERLFEFCTEGKRWWDLRRFQQVFNLVPSLAGRSNDTWALLFPIGKTILSLEPKVVENQGW